MHTKPDKGVAEEHGNEQNDENEDDMNWLR